jgi:glycosyltransferase involved in cell wall biosynthesis
VKKLLLVAYYTPPLGMSGVMRVTKLAKYLPRFGWEPLVLTVKPIAYYHFDRTLAEDWKDIRVFRAGSLDPARLRYLLMPGRPLSQAGLGRTSRLANILCFPDAKAGWFPFARRLGRKLIQDEHPDAIFASAPPFTALMIGAALKRDSGLPLVSDFRDPFPTGFVPPPKFLLGRVERLRHDLLAQSDHVLAVNYGTASFLEGKAEVLENGFDPADFEPPARRFDGFSIVHVGNVWENEPEFRAVLDATKDMAGVKVRLVGKLPVQSGRHGGLPLQAAFPHFENLGLLSHSATLSVMKGADLLLYLSKPNQSAGIKLYEYLGAGRPILSVCAECTEAARLIEQHHAGVAVSVNRDEIRAAVEQALGGKLEFAPQGIERYSRVNQAERLAGLLNRLTANR